MVYRACRALGMAIAPRPAMVVGFSLCRFRVALPASPAVRVAANDTRGNRREAPQRDPAHRRARTRSHADFLLQTVRAAA